MANVCALADVNFWMLPMNLSCQEHALNMTTPSKTSKYTSPTVIATAAGIQNGDSTHNQLHVMTWVSFRATKSTSRSSVVRLE